MKLNKVQKKREEGSKNEKFLENRNKINAISGLKGVVPAHNGRWKSQIGHKGKVIYLGTYDTKEEAHDIYLKASLVFHTHNQSFKSSE